MSQKRTIDVQDGDEQWVLDFERDISLVCGLIEEVMHENKVLLLSPVFREMIVDHGRRLHDKLRKVSRRLCVDNLGDPLSGKAKGGDA